MLLITPPHQKGIGLIEVLVATIVIALGLMAVASLQSNLMLGSGDNKIRAEAQTLAEAKIEQFRNNIDSAGYNALAAGNYTDPGNPIAGKNASFNRSWVVAGGNAPARKTITVTVGWDSDRDGDIDNADDKVLASTEMAFIDPAKSAMYATEQESGGIGATPSPRQNASEDVASQQVLGQPASSVSSGTPGSTSTVTVTVTDPDPNGGGTSTVTLTQIAPGSHYYATADTSLFFVDPGVIAVFICEGSSCTYIQNHFGGVVHRIAGTVYSTSPAGLTHIQVAWTSSDVNACYNGPITQTPASGSLQYNSRPYECVLAGNCDATADGVNRCYPDSQVSDAQIAARDVGPGGEFGDVGLLGVIDSGGNREQVCFLEDTGNPSTSPLLQASGSQVMNENYLFPVTKRFYVTRQVSRNGSINVEKSEGINRSYTNHNFLIIERGSGSSANQQCNSKATTYSFVIPPREIVRTLNESEDNQVPAETTYAGSAGTAVTLTGVISSTGTPVTDMKTDLALYIPETGTCYIKNDTTAYACAVASGSSNVVIKGVSAEHPTSSPAVFTSCTSTGSNCLWPSSFN
ncbi:MAG: type IV pilus modification PilV family protein [Gammaproteobacteria bacterium]